MSEEEKKEKWVKEAIQREATPKKLRKETIAQFCKRHGIDPSTYHYNMRKEENRKEVVDIWLDEALNGGNEVLEALRDKAKGGDTRAIEIYLKFVLKLKERLELSGDKDNPLKFDIGLKKEIEEKLKNVINED